MPFSYVEMMEGFGLGDYAQLPELRADTAGTTCQTFEPFHDRVVQ